MDERPTIRDVVDKLATTGSADQLAAFFEHEGVVGDRNNATSCPIANYVHAQTGLPIIAGQLLIMRDDEPLRRGDDIDRVDYWDKDTGNRIEQYRPLGEFVVNFDTGSYPALVRTRP